MTSSSNNAAPAGLRWWLILLTLAALLCSRTAGIFGGWRVFRRRLNRLAVGWSLVAAVPMFLVAGFFLYFIVISS